MILLKTEETSSCTPNADKRDSFVVELFKLPRPLPPPPKLRKRHLPTRERLISQLTDSLMPRSAPGPSDPRPRPQPSSSPTLPLNSSQTRSTSSTKSGLTDGNWLKVLTSFLDTIPLAPHTLVVVFQTPPWQTQTPSRASSSTTTAQLSSLTLHTVILIISTPKEAVRPGSTNQEITVVHLLQLQLLIRMKKVLQQLMLVVLPIRLPRDGSVVLMSPAQPTSTPSKTATTPPSPPSTPPLPATTPISLTSRPPTKRMPSPPSSHHQRSQPWSRDQELQPCQPPTPVLLTGQPPTKLRCSVGLSMHQRLTENNSSSETMITVDGVPGPSASSPILMVLIGPRRRSPTPSVCSESPKQPPPASDGVTSRTGKRPTLQAPKLQFRLRLVVQVASCAQLPPQLLPTHVFQPELPLPPPTPSTST